MTDHDVDLPALRAGRLARLQAAMREHDLDVCLLFNEPNTRYQWAARVNQGTRALNDAVETAAVVNGAVFVDVEAAFAGHGVGSSSPWINDWSWLRTTDGFHPTATGYVAFAGEIRKVIG